MHASGNRSATCDLSSSLRSSLDVMPKAFLVKQKTRGPVKPDRKSESPIGDVTFLPTRLSAESIHLQALIEARRSRQASPMVLPPVDGEAIDHRKSTLDNIRKNGRVLGGDAVGEADDRMRLQRQVIQCSVQGNEQTRLAAIPDIRASLPVTVATVAQHGHHGTAKIASSNTSTTFDRHDGIQQQISSHLPPSIIAPPTLTATRPFPGSTPQAADQHSQGGGVIGSNWIYGRLPVAAIPGFPVPTAAAAAAAAAAFFGCSPNSSSASLWASCLQRLSSGNFNSQPDWPAMPGGFRYAADAPVFPLGSKFASSSAGEKIAALGNIGPAFWPPWHDQLHPGSKFFTGSDGGATRHRFTPSPKSDVGDLPEPRVDRKRTEFRRPEMANTTKSAQLTTVRDDIQPTLTEQVSDEVVSSDDVDDDRMQLTRRRAQVPPRFQCEACAKSYSTANGLTKHREFHCTATAAGRARRQFVCPHCVAIASASGGGETSPSGSSTSSGSSVTSAAVTAAAAKTYSSIGALKMHIRTHTLPCRCPQCGKAFSRPWLLQGHLRTHTGERPFQCSECRRSFADRSNLRAHLQTHADVKRYRCRSCSKTFSRMSLLLKHKEHGTGCC